MGKSAQDSQFRWVVLGMLAVASISSSMIMISFAPLIGVIRDDLHISAGVVNHRFRSGSDRFPDDALHSQPGGCASFEGVPCNSVDGERVIPSEFPRQQERSFRSEMKSWGD
jgi:hypothetical protein